MREIFFFVATIYVACLLLQNPAMIYAVCSFISNSDRVKTGQCQKNPPWGHNK